MLRTTRGRNSAIIRCTVAESVHEGVQSMAQTAEVIIVGGGIPGASIAYHLRQDGLTGRLLVIERDTTYSRATTPMSMGEITGGMGPPAISRWHATACGSTSSSTN